MRFAGADIGTSGLKAALVDESGHVVDERAVDYATTEPRPGWCEIDPDQWLQAYRSATSDLGDIDAVGFAGQMHGIVVTDASGTPLRPAVLWPDQRAESITADWERTGELDDLDTPIKSGYAAATLAWLAVHEPEVIARTERVWFVKDWVRSRLTGESAAMSERSDASASLLWDPRTQTWSPDAARLAGIATAALGDLRAPTEVAGSIGGVPAVIGGADTAVALDAYRALVPERGTVYVNVGSGCQIIRSHALRPQRSNAAECVFADTREGWYAMRALDVRAISDRAALAAVVADALSEFGPERVVVGGGAARDARFRGELRGLLAAPLIHVSLRSLSACGAAMLAAIPLGRRIGLRHDAFEVSEG